MKVPTYQGNQVRSKDSVEMGASVNTPVEAYGGGKANQLAILAKAGSVYNDIYLDFKKKADEIKVTEAQYKLADYTGKMMNPVDGALSRKGKDSFDLLSNFPDEYSKALSEIEKDLSDDQKAMFSGYSVKEKMRIERQLQDHVSTETIRYDNETTKNFVNSMKNRAAADYKDLDAVDSYIKDISIKLEEKAVRDGMSKADISALIDKETSEAYAGTIQQMIANDKEDVALEYFNFKKSEIKDAETREKLQKMVDEGANRKNAQKMVDQFVTSGQSETAAYNKARQIEDSKLRKEVEDRIKLDYGRRDAARKDALEKTTIRMFNMVEKGGDPRKDPVWQSLEPAQRNTIIAYMKRAVDGDEAVTDPVLYRGLKDKISDPETRNEFMKENLFNYVNKLNKNQFDELRGLQLDLRNGKFDLANDVGSKNEVFKNTVESIGGYNDEKKAVLKLKIDTIESNLEKARGKKLSPVEYQQELDNLLKNEITSKKPSQLLTSIAAAVPVAGPALSTVVGGIKFGTSKKIIDLSSEDIENISYESIPKQDAQVLERVLQASGEFPSPEAVTELYKEKLREIHGVAD
jgi:hypothetical protein